MQKQLLPIGFYDLIFDEAKQNHDNINKVLDLFFAAGYSLIKTPLVEFEDNFDVANNNKDNLFRSVGVISGKNLVFRNDITPQISRLLKSRLSETKLPLKICYSGDVLCSKSQDLYADRQQSQVGVEIIGNNLEQAQFDVINIAIAALEKLAVKNLLIEFSLPNFVDLFLKEIACNNCDELRQAIRTKNLSKIRELEPKNAEIITKIVTSNNNLEAITAEILQKFNSNEIAKQLEIINNLASLVKDNKEVSFRFDLFGDHGSSYHSEISFDIFCDDFSYPIARGGRYKINEFDAVGATIYMNRLHKLAKNV